MKTSPDKSRSTGGLKNHGNNGNHVNQDSDMLSVHLVDKRFLQ